MSYCNLLLNMAVHPITSIGDLGVVGGSPESSQSPAPILNSRVKGRQHWACEHKEEQGLLFGGQRKPRADSEITGRGQMAWLLGVTHFSGKALCVWGG